MTTDERIANLRRGIASAATPDHLKAQMQEQLDELLAPPPPPPPPPPRPRPAPKPKAVTPPPQPVLTAEQKAERRRQIEERLAKRKDSDE